MINYPIHPLTHAPVPPGTQPFFHLHQNRFEVIYKKDTQNKIPKKEMKKAKQREKARLEK